jgi:hypothetical protein
VETVWPRDTAHAVNEFAVVAGTEAEDLTDGLDVLKLPGFSKTHISISKSSE